jgi:Zn-dependent protease
MVCGWAWQPTGCRLQWQPLALHRSVLAIPGVVTVARVSAVDIAVHWRWVAALALGTIVLASYVLPSRLPGMEGWTLWLVALGAMLVSEATLLLHELGHAVAAKGLGQQVERIVFHGLMAETILGQTAPGPGREALIALTGPCISILVGAAIAVTRLWLEPGSPLDAAARLLMFGNLGLAVLSLVPIGHSDGGRAVRALRRVRD